MLPLSREAILAAGSRPVVTVEVPEWGGAVCLRPLSGAEVSAIYADETKDRHQVTETMVAVSICDAEGNRLFKPVDAPALFDKAYAGLKPLISKVMEINRLSAEAADAARKD